MKNHNHVKKTKKKYITKVKRSDVIKINRIYNIDCIKFMQKLINENKIKFDVIVTSPPYNINKYYTRKLIKEEFFAPVASAYLAEDTAKWSKHEREIIMGFRSTG